MYIADIKPRTRVATPAVLLLCSLGPWLLLLRRAQLLWLSASPKPHLGPTITCTDPGPGFRLGLFPLRLLALGLGVTRQRLQLVRQISKSGLMKLGWASGSLLLSWAGHLSRQNALSRRLHA